MMPYLIADVVCSIAMGMLLGWQFVLYIDRVTGVRRIGYHRYLINIALMFFLIFLSAKAQRHVCDSVIYDVLSVLLIGGSTALTIAFLRRCGRSRGAS